MINILGKISSPATNLAKSQKDFTEKAAAKQATSRDNTKASADCGGG